MANEKQVAFLKQSVAQCRNCGKPATRVVPGYYSVSLGALCDTCKLKGDEKDYISEEELLPIVNSPRVGVCSYTGGADGWDGEEWDGAYDEEEEEK